MHMREKQKVYDVKLSSIVANAMNIFGQASYL